MKKLLLALFITVFISGGLRAQCSPNCTLYTVASITPNLLPSAGTSVFLSDDQLSGAMPIGFTFTFMCTAYTQMYICSNGFISFNGACSQGCCSGQSIPSIGNAVNNIVAWDWNDLYPPGGGTIQYQTIGTAPNRICVITWSNIPHCCNNGPAFNTGQIKLFETSNAIEVHSGVVTTDGSTATQGIMNQAGNIAVPVVGRNGVTWTSSSDAYRWTIAGGGPVAPPAILGNVSICPGVATIYSVAPMVGASSYNWTLPVGWTGASTSNTILATPGASGILSVTATFSCGTSTVTTLSVTVNPSPTISITGGTTAVCPGNSVALTAGGANTYTWNPGGLTGPNITVNPTTSVQYTVIGTSVAGCTASAVQDVTVSPGPTVSISGNLQICAGGTVFLTASGANTYTWSNGANSPNIVVTPPVNTTYSVVGMLGMCPGTAAVNVTVNPLPILSVAGSNTACAGSTINLVASGANTYTWNTGATSAAIAVTPTANVGYTVVGTNTVTGCSSSTTFSINVNAIPTITVTGPTAMCLNQTITLTGYGANTYSWSTGSITQSIAVSPITNTSYTVIGTSTLGCAGAPVVKNVVVNPIPAVPVSATSTFICKGETTTLTASGVNTYSWNNGALTPTIAVSPSVTTTYTVMGTNTLTGCYKTTTISIVVSLCTGIGNAVVSSVNLSLHPNPNNGEFVIEFKNGLKKSIDVCDMMGRNILSTTSEDDQIEMNIGNFANGIYYVKIQSDDVFKVVKIIKQ